MARLAILVAFLFFASTAMAAAPERTITVTPDPPHVGDVLTFSGCGYLPGKDVAVAILMHGGDGLHPLFSKRVDDNGCFYSSSWFAPDAAGIWHVYVYPKTGSGVGTYGHHKAIADYEFEVLP